MSDAIESKRELRRRMKAVRSGMDAELRARTDQAICDRLTGLDAYRQADVVLPYLSFGSEVDTRELIRRALDAGKIVALPRVMDGERRMNWYRIYGLSGLERSALGVDEPAADPVREVDPCASSRALAIVPALTFDEAGFRLGYGGGYYDTFLGFFPGVAVGLCRDAQFVPDLGDLGVLEAHDGPVNIVVTESRTIRAL